MVHMVDDTQNNKSVAQKGFVAIIVATLIMVILSLITIGFTRIMQREQRQALDRQLSRQALYAAESGINDVYAAIQSGSLADEEYFDCNPDVLGSNNIVDDEGVSAYTCIQYDIHPPEIVYELEPNQSEISQFETKDDTADNNFKSLTFEWGISQGNNNLASTKLSSCSSTAAAKRLPSTRNDTVPVLRIDITDFDLATLDRSTLVQSTEYIYALPCRGSATTHAYNTTSRGDIVLVGCEGDSAARPCILTINGLTKSKYSARIKSVYAGASVRITGRQGTADDSAEFVNVQWAIDVTARTNDVVRRLRAAVPVSGVSNLTGIPEGGVHSSSGVCKLLSVDTNPASRALDNYCPL